MARPARGQRSHASAIRRHLRSNNAKVEVRSVHRACTDSIEAASICGLKKTDYNTQHSQMTAELQYRYSGSHACDGTQAAVPRDL
jgi:hypothetical protein